MGLFNGLIAILAIKVFLKVNTWHVNAVSFSDYHLLRKFRESESHERDITTLNNSKCDEMIRRDVPTFYPYEEMFMSRDIHKTRYNYRRESVNAWVCGCEGYVRSGMRRCVPRCPASCKKGTCKEPDVCTCNKGYRMSTDDKRSCVPECTKGCVSGTCLEPEVCYCNDGYWMDSDGFTCRPICKEECERNHGYCPQPNLCACKKGYRVSTNNKELCVPECTPDCVNGICAVPHVCRCNEGYLMTSDGFTCRAICNAECERKHGYCSEPNVCTCNSGYRKIGNDSSSFACEPVCSECDLEKDVCIAPNHCVSCVKGYEIDKRNPPTCKPIKCDQPCIFGTCTAPGTCTCDQGYKLSGVNSNICEPICEIDCGNGKCIEPGLCICDEGFVYDETKQTCKPHCSTPCEWNEECTAPNICTCIKGYHHIFTSKDRKVTRENWTNLRRYQAILFICVPNCDFTCINGKCTAPNVCTCHPNYYPRWIEYHHSLRKTVPRICDPLPGPPCDKFSCGDKGTCHKSGICICNDGYRRDTNGDCVPVCAQACSNGTCTAPNRCGCYDGFAPRNDSFCEPICEKGCQNGDCTGPNQCVCHDDFIPNVNYDSGPECIPECTRNCSGHGECVISSDIDYKCECHFGWVGQDCDQPSMCVIAMPYDHDNINRITIRNDTNSTIMQAYEDISYCECEKFLDNETLCYTQSDKGNTTFINCLFSTDLPCYTTPRYNASIKVTKIVWPFVTIAILLTMGLTAAAYFIYRKRQKEKLAIGPSAHVFIRESFSTEFLLQ